jgi:ribulose-5-phosphate 4-epimerase/fuculose-1-phosphate aldolase
MDDASKPIVELVAQACRVLGKLELTHGAFGHVSFRRGESETLLIKGKGPEEVGLRYTRPDDIIEVDFKADMVSGAAGLQPPSESYLHIWLYRLNPEVRSVVHVHPEHAVLLTICDIDVVRSTVRTVLALGSRSRACRRTSAASRSATTSSDRSSPSSWAPAKRR